MHKTSHYFTRWVILIFFCIYALSPVFLSVQTDDDAGPAVCRQHVGNISIGIVWVNILLSSITERYLDDMGACCATESATVLVKKKRAVFRERLDIKPIPVTAALVLGSPEFIIEVPREFEISRDPQHRENSCYRFLNAGLSPPPFLS